MKETNDFYEAWAIEKLQDKTRENVLKWKAVNFLNLLLRNNLNSFTKVCEVGGAEGILLNTLDKIISIESIKNYDISAAFCKAGSELYPRIQFINQEFNINPEFHDLILLSDITEHVENDYEFMNAIRKHCEYLLIKIPIEKSLVNSALLYTLRLKRRPENLKYGEKHINGHLRGYSILQAKKLVSKYFHVMDYEISAVDFFNPSKKKKWIKKIFGTQIFIRIYGGAFFALAKVHTVSN